MTPEETAEAEYIAGLTSQIIVLIEEYEAENAGKILDPTRVKDLNRSAVGEAYDLARSVEIKSRR